VCIPEKRCGRLAAATATMPVPMTEAYQFAATFETICPRMPRPPSRGAEPGPASPDPEPFAGGFVPMNSTMTRPIRIPPC
jgi:hypothetical protein